MGRESNVEAHAAQNLRDTLKAEVEVRRESLLNMAKEIEQMDMSTVTTHEINQLAYKTMNPFIYYFVNVAMFVMQAVLGIILNDIGLVFGFMGTFAGVGLCYIMPSWFFYRGYMHFATKKYKGENRIDFILCLFNGAIGVPFFVLFLYANILSVKDA